MIIRFHCFLKKKGSFFVIRKEVYNVLKKERNRLIAYIYSLQIQLLKIHGKTFCCIVSSKLVTASNATYHVSLK